MKGVAHLCIDRTEDAKVPISGGWRGRAWSSVRVGGRDRDVACLESKWIEEPDKRHCHMVKRLATRSVQASSWLARGGKVVLAGRRRLQWRRRGGAR